MAHEDPWLVAADMMPSLFKAELVSHGKSSSEPCGKCDTSLLLVMVFIVMRFTVRRQGVIDAK